MSDILSSQSALTPGSETDQELGLTATSLVNALPGPAVLAWSNGRIISANLNASDLVLEGGDGNLALRSDLLTQVATIERTGTAQSWVIKIKKPGHPGLVSMSCSLTGIPLAVCGDKTTAVLIYGADSVLERNLRQALIASRTFYQDLANCSSDFTWATDTKGVFTYINQKGVAGYHADMMHGKPALELLSLRTTRSQAEAVFHARLPVSEKEIWLKGASGEDFCFMISALPVREAGSKWCGARGVGRDVTELRTREAELHRARRAEKLINTVLGIIRNEVAPAKMLATAAAAVIEAIGMTSCWIFQRKYNEEFTSTTGSVLNIVPRASLDMENAPTSAVLRAIVAKNLKNQNSHVAVFTKSGWSFLIARTEYRDQINGTLCFVRQLPDSAESEMKKPVWDHFERSLISCVADQLSVVIAQSEHQEKLKLLSQTDGLTGLMNRRSFLPETTRRLAHHERQNRKAAFLYIDLDNFKGINDNDGHACGDQILCVNCRTSDLSARFGGDEFVVWLEEADEAIAILKANDLIDSCQDIIAITKNASRNHVPALHPGEMSFTHLGMSIGIAIFIPGTKETIDQLLGRADAALNIAKKAGKGGYRLAAALSPPPFNEQDSKNAGDG